MPSILFFPLVKWCLPIDRATILFVIFAEKREKNPASVTLFSSIYQENNGGSIMLDCKCGGGESASFLYPLSYIPLCFLYFYKRIGGLLLSILVSSHFRWWLRWCEGMFMNQSPFFLNGKQSTKIVSVADLGKTCVSIKTSFNKLLGLHKWAWVIYHYVLNCIIQRFYIELTSVWTVLIVP